MPVLPACLTAWQADGPVVGVERDEARQVRVLLHGGLCIAQRLFRLYVVQQDFDQLQIGALEGLLDTGMRSWAFWAVV